MGVLPHLVMRQDAHADGAKRPEVKKKIIVYDVGFFHQLHIASCCVYKIQSVRYSFPRWLLFKSLLRISHFL